MRSRARIVALVGLLIVAVAGLAGASCVVDPDCGCRAANCGDFAGNFKECLKNCGDQPNCAGLVTCMKPCYARRDAARARCNADTEACTRADCLICTDQAPRTAVPQAQGVQNVACARACRTKYQQCLGTYDFLRRVRDKCRAGCSDKCGKFDNVPAALTQCLSNCDDDIGLPSCKEDRNDCLAGCESP